MDMHPRSLTGPGFVKGSLIRTKNGDVPIETLNVGDKVVNQYGEESVIKEIAQVYTPDCTTNPDYTPMVIPANTLGANLPSQDLYVLSSRSVQFQGEWFHVDNLPQNFVYSNNKNPEYYDIQLEKYMIDFFYVNNMLADSWDGLSPLAPGRNPTTVWRCEQDKSCTRGKFVVQAPQPIRFNQLVKDVTPAKQTVA